MHLSLVKEGASQRLLLAVLDATFWVTKKMENKQQEKFLAYFFHKFLGVSYKIY